MATLNTTQAAPLIVSPGGDAQYLADDITAITFDPEGVCAVEGDDGAGHALIAGVAAGTTTVTVRALGNTGTLDVTVTAAPPLWVGLGEARPRA